MRTITAAVAALSLSACVTTPETLTRDPQANVQATAGVGDALYTYEFTPQVMTDPYGNVTPMGAGTVSVRQELLYSGMSNGQLDLAYREFSNDFARPAFTQQASYDYHPDTEITFKGAMITVLVADNNTISYVVRNGFSNERQPSAE